MWKKILLSSLIPILGISILHSAPFAKANDARIVQIYSVCAATQGNGYNWAATFSWLAEQYDEVANRARAAELSGKSVAIHLDCFAGGSSGAAVTLALDALRTNSALLGAAADKDLLSVSEVEVLVRALRALGFAADVEEELRPALFIRFGRQAALARLSPKFEVMPDGTVDVWNEVLDAKVAAADFANLIQFAQVLDRGSLDWHYAGYDPFSDYPAFGANYYSEMSREWQRTQMGPIVDRSLDENPHRGWLARMSRRNEGIRPALEGEQEGTNRAYKQTMARKLHSGFSTTALGAFYPSMADYQRNLTSRRAVNYQSELRQVMFMDESTANALLSSRTYQEELGQDPARTGFISRYVIAVVDQRFSAMNASIREPGLLDELAAPLGAGALGISKIFDPRDRDRPDLRLYSVRGDKALEDRVLFVIGGFPFREQIAWLPSLLQDAIAARLSDRADQVIRTLHIFGKAVVPGSPGFAEKQIASDLLAKETSPEANLQDWFAWVEEVLRKIPESTALYSTDYDWDETGRLPAALAGRSHLLVVNSAAESRRAIFRKNFERANVREPILPLR